MGYPSPQNPYEPMFNSKFADSRMSQLFSHIGGLGSAAALDKRVDNLENFAKRVDQWASTLQVNNNLQDTGKGLSVLNKLKAEADV